MIKWNKRYNDDHELIYQLKLFKRDDKYTSTANEIMDTNEV